MTATTAIQHKPWCREHQTDFEGEFCFAGFSWGPKRPDDGTLNGEVWASQQVATFGAFKIDDEPTVAIELGARSIHLRIEDLPSLKTAIADLLEVFGLST